jgi:hypothetical protein
MRRPESALRDALDSLPRDPYQIEPPRARFTYVPASHVRALHPDNMLVVGARGTGKSFWWKALLTEETRLVVAQWQPLPGTQALRVSAGWSDEPRADYPDRDVLASLLNAGFVGRHIWKTVLLLHVAPGAFPPDVSRWSARTEWLRENPEDVAAALRAADEAAYARGERHLILFDAFDRTADNLAGRRALLRGLLELVLEVRSLRAIRAKAFLRDDMIEDPEITAFPDSSKVVGSRVELKWPKQELYGLLWQYLGNADAGAELFRSLVPGWSVRGGVHVMPEVLRNDEPTQRRVFALIAGNLMGTNERRGLPYTWVLNHLADARGVVTPRSFIAALGAAVVGTPENSRHPIHWKGLLAGVQKAAEYRQRELQEDFLWSATVMNALRGMEVPCERAKLVNHWNLARVTAQIANAPEAQRNRRAAGGPSGLIEDLKEIGVLEVRPDGRYNIPDVYRVGFGIKRRGGVKPVR